MSTLLDDDHPKTVGAVVAVILILSLFVLLTGCASTGLAVVGPAKPIMTSYTIPAGVTNCKKPEFFKLSNGRTMLYLQCEQHSRKQWCDVFYALDAETGKELDKVKICAEYPVHTTP